MNTTVTPLTISKVEQEQSSSVWALNSSDSRETGKGIVNVTITEGNGRPSVVRIPVTFIPVDLTMQATKPALMMSPDFRRLVGARIITLISEEDAQKLLQGERAKAEQRRLLDIEQMHEVQESQRAPEVKAVMDQAKGTISGRALNIAHTSEGDEEVVLTNLRNNAESMTQEDLQYIVNNSVFPKVKALAAEFVVKV